MSDRILLTGATGFIGKAIARAAVACGHKVLALVRPGREAELPPGTQAVRGSLAELPWEEVKRFEPTVCVHAAWISTPGVYLESPENESLVRWSKDFMAGARSAGVQHAVVLGTCIEYAPSDSPLIEQSSVIAPASLYAESKVRLWKALQADPVTSGMGLAWARIFYPYGAGEHPQRVCSSICRKLLRGEAIELKTPDSVKDYIHVKDVAEAILRILNMRFRGEINVGTGTGISIWDLAGLIARNVGASGQVKRAPVAGFDAYPRVVADSGRLRSLGWEPAISLEQGTLELCESLREELAA